MTELSELFGRMRPLLEQKWTADASSSTPNDGSTTKTGPSIISSTPVPMETPLASKEEVIPAVLSIPPDASSKSAQREPLNWRKCPISDSLEAQASLTAIILRLYISQKRYGLSDEDLLIREKDFQKALGRFCIDDVDAAIYAYTLEHDDIPVVANILRILEPPPPVFNPTMVVSIKKEIRDGVPVSDLKRAYCRGYEQQELGKVEQLKQYQQRQVSARTKAQLIASTAVGDIDSEEGLVKKEETQA